MNEDLINQIVRRILSDPALQTLLEGSRAGNGELKMLKPSGLILLNYVSNLGRVLNALKHRYGADYTLNVLPSDQVYRIKPELPEGMTWIDAEEALAKRDWQTLILPTCSANSLAKVALGIRDNPISEIIGRGITEGKTIELVTEYLGFTPQTPQAYRDLYEGYLQKVQTYGILVKASLDDECSIEMNKAKVANLNQERPTNLYDPRPVTTSPKTANSELSTPQGEAQRFTKKFLGDKQAYGFPEDSKIFVSQGTVISPLARDTLKVRRIELCVEKEKEEGRR